MQCVVKAGALMIYSCRRLFCGEHDGTCDSSPPEERLMIESGELVKWTLENVSALCLSTFGRIHCFSRGSLEDVFPL